MARIPGARTLCSAARHGDAVGSLRWDRGAMRGARETAAWIQAVAFREFGYGGIAARTCRTQPVAAAARLIHLCSPPVIPPLGPGMGRMIHIHVGETDGRMTFGWSCDTCRVDDQAIDPDEGFDSIFWHLHNHHAREEIEDFGKRLGKGGVAMVQTGLQSLAGLSQDDDTLGRLMDGEMVRRGDFDLLELADMEPATMAQLVEEGVRASLDRYQAGAEHVVTMFRQGDGNWYAECVDHQWGFDGSMRSVGEALGMHIVHRHDPERGGDCIARLVAALYGLAGHSQDAAHQLTEGSADEPADSDQDEEAT